MGLQCGAPRANCNVVFDWYGNFRRYAEERRMAAASARSVVVDYGRDADALSNPQADYFVLTAEHIGAKLCNLICQLAARHWRSLHSEFARHVHSIVSY